jgi:hypothetical protein
MSTQRPPCVFLPRTQLQLGASSPRSPSSLGSTLLRHLALDEVDADSGSLSDFSFVNTPGTPCLVVACSASMRLLRGTQGESSVSAPVQVGGPSCSFTRRGESPLSGRASPSRNSCSSLLPKNLRVASGPELCMLIDSEVALSLCFGHVGMSDRFCIKP